MSKCCKECPWKVKNRHNEMFTDHVKKHDKSHNCHMKTKDVWNTEKETECQGYKNYKDSN